MFENVVLHIKPWALVLRLVLYPNELFDMCIFLHFGLELFVPKGVELLDTNNCNIVALALFALLDQIDRKSTRLNSSHVAISYAVFFLKIKMFIDQMFLHDFYILFWWRYCVLLSVL